MVLNSSESNPNGLVVDPVTGKIVVAGNNRLWRYNADGSADNSFGSNPTINYVYIANEVSSISDLVLTGDGKIVVAGYKYHTTNGVAASRFRSARYHGLDDPDAGIVAGALDTSFSAGDADGSMVRFTWIWAASSVTARYSEEYLYDLTVDSQGRVVATGYSNLYDISNNSWIACDRRTLLWFAWMATDCSTPASASVRPTTIPVRSSARTSTDSC